MKEPLRAERKCPICDKAYIIQRGAGWIYKKKDKDTGEMVYYCGYTCAKKAGWKG